MRPIPAFLAVLALALSPALSPALPGQAFARDMSGPLDAGGFYAWMNMGPVGETIRQDMRNGKYGPAEQARQRADDGPRPAAPVAVASLRYTPSLDRRAANLAGFVAKSRQVDPRGAEQLRALFARTDIIEAMRAPLAKAGLRIDDLADAYAAWWITAWYASRGSNETPDPRAVAAVRAQAARALSASPAMRGADDAAKQQMAEALLIQAAMLDGAVEQSRGTPDLMNGVRAAAAKGARGMGLDLASMALTEKGFAPS